VKEALCYVSADFLNDLKITKTSGGRGNIAAKDPNGTSLRRSFVLPDFQNVMRGFVKREESPITEHEQLLWMESERFSVPELLFSPSIVGLQQAGIAEATWQALRKLNTVEIGLTCANIVLTGGNMRLPFMKERFEMELRQYLPIDFPVSVHLPSSPETFSYSGLARYHQDQWRSYGSGGPAVTMVSKREYQEYGHHYCNRKFDSVNKLT
jgi:actin-related protein 6